MSSNIPPAVMQEIFARLERLEQQVAAIPLLARKTSTLRHNHDQLAGAVGRFCAAVDSDPHMHEVMSQWRGEEAPAGEAKAEEVKEVKPC